MTANTPTWNRSETKTKVLTVVEDGALGNLTLATDIEYQLKTAPEVADPPLISLSVGFGITLRTQAGETLGQADILIPSAAVDALAPGTYYEEVCVIWADGRRTYPIPARKVIVKGVVNRPPSAAAPLPAPAAAPQDGTIQSFVWTAGADGTLVSGRFQSTVAIPQAMRDASYVVGGFNLRDPAAGDDAHPDARFPAAGRTTATFLVTTDAPIRAGSSYDVLLRDA
jgi:hypothetical protein